MAVNIKNKKASYTYFLTDEFTAGLVLSGSEITDPCGQGEHHRVLLSI